MSVRFVLGRAGTGKTHHCLSAIRQRLRESPVVGPRLLFLVPEQASQQIEWALFQPQDASQSVEVIHRAEVFSFRSLAERLLQIPGGQSRECLSDVSRIMVLRHLAADLAPQLTYYQRVLRHPGFLERLASTISELIQEGILPGDIPQETESGVLLRAPGARKCHDLALIYGAYLRFLGDRRYDPSQVLSMARARLPQCDWIRGAEVWMDGFASLGGEESATVLDLARIVSHFEIAVLLDPSQGAESPARPARSIFARTARTYEELNRSLAAGGLTIDPPLFLNPVPPHRFARTPSLAALERNLFASAGSGGSAISDLQADRQDVVAVVRLPSRRAEVEYAVSRICEWTRGANAKYRYRDIAIIVRDLEPYHDLIHPALEDRAIASFIDRRRPVVHHPLVELLRGVLRIAVEGMSLDWMRILLKTGLLPLSRDLADELENYILAHGIQGLEAWSRAEWAHRRVGSKSDRVSGESAWAQAAQVRVNQARRAVLDSLVEWLHFAAVPEGHAATEWSRALTDLMARLSVPENLAKWSEQSGATGDLNQAAEHEQLATDITKFFESMDIAFGDRVLSAREAADVMEAGLSGLTLGLVPPTVDQVLVGSIERTRHPDIKAAILLGFNDGVFPARIEEDTILNDDDRNQWLDAGIRIGQPARQKLHEEAMLVYIALTRPSQELVVTWCATNDKGEPLNPSPFLRDLLAAVPGLSMTSLGDAQADRSMWDIQNRNDLRSRILIEFNRRAPRSLDASPARARWNELYEKSRSELASDSICTSAFAALKGIPGAALSAESVNRIHPDTLATSVSGLENYAACPFKYFAERMLRLRKRPQAQLEAMDMGTVHHAILEEFAGDLIRQGKGLGQMSLDEMESTLRAGCVRAAQRLHDGDGPATARDAYVLRRAARRISRVLITQQKVAATNTLRPAAAELSFGMNDGGLPPLTIKTPNGRMVRIRGFVDRVDLVGERGDQVAIVVDYKATRDKSLDFSEVYHGLSLQLLTYLVVLSELGLAPEVTDIRPGGALYVSLGSQYHLVQHPGDAPDRDSMLKGTYRPRGVLNADELASLNLEYGKSSWASHLSVHVGKDGELGNVKGNDAVAGPTFQALLDHTKKRLGELSDGILNGDIAVRPCRLGKFTPCLWCTMSSVCRFEYDLFEEQVLPKLERAEVCKKVRPAKQSSQNENED